MIVHNISGRIMKSELYMKLKLVIYIFACVIAVLIYVSVSSAGTDSEDTIMDRKVIRAPELNGGTGWLNTDRPLYIKDLKGKLVLLDFWAYACINCMHVIPDLKRLEAKYSKELVVIGVHSAKFTNESDSDNIRQAILRYGIDHPVVNDSEFRIWRSYGVRSWPTLVLIDPDGYVSGSVSGEGNYEILDKAIEALIAEFSKDDKIDRNPLSLALEKNKIGESFLSFPGKIISNSKEELLYISDSNNNRILITDIDGNVRDIIGSGNTGKEDGDFDSASFNKPQGVALDGNYLYIADTENHIIRRCNLMLRAVETIAGTGNQSKRFDNKGEALQTDLNSPWDLVIIGDRIYIAMAGPHQIWVMDLKDNYIQPYAGSGREGRVDGTLKESALAQPSGITTDGKKLFIADSESSSIRSVDLYSDGKVETIVGLDLFEFGDVDGRGREVRLQHPLGVMYNDGKIYVADTYNHKIKIVDPEEKTSKTFLGTGNPGKTDGKSSSFYEPGGLTILGNRIYIADTNNHSVRVADLSTGVVSTLDIKTKTSGLPVEKLVYPSRKIRSGSSGNIVLDVKFPPTFGLTEGAPMDYEIKPCTGIKIDESDRNKTIDEPKLPLNIPFTASDEIGNCLLSIDLTFNYCNKKDETCSVKSLRLQVPIQISKDEGSQTIMIEYRLTP